MKRITFVILIILITTVYLFAIKNDKMTVRDYVPNSETAIKVAEAVWLPIYGDKIFKEKPYNVSLKDNKIWIVTGSIAKNKRGGVAYIEIQKSDCKILKVVHGK